MEKMSRQSLRDIWKNFDAILFDMDGTVVDSMWMWYDIDVEYLGRYGFTLPKDLHQAIEGMSFSETAVYFKERFSLNDSLDKIKQDWIAMAIDKYRHAVPFKPGAQEFLSRCRKAGIRLGIATSNSRELVNEIADELHFDEYFECIITSCEVKRGKPAPDVYLAVAEQLQVKPEKCLVFEDIPAGIMAGKNAGMQVCAIEDVYSAEFREEKQRLADYYIEDYRELL